MIALSGLMLAFSSACNQEGSAQNQEARETVESAVETPEMDINMAVISGAKEVVAQHIAAGSDLNQKDPMTGSTPLITASTFNQLAIAKMLIKAGSDLSIQNNDGSSALHSAAFFGRIEIVQVLVDVGIDKNLLNNFGFTAHEMMLGDFTEVKPVYEMLQAQLSPMGLTLDLEEIEAARPVIAVMLQD